MSQLTLTAFRDGGTECPTCGGEFASEGGMKHHHAQVHGKSIRGVEFLCDGCGSRSRKKRSHLKHAHNYCSEECRADGFGDHTSGERHPQWNGGLVTLECEQCGGNFDVTPSRQGEAKYCSTECSGKANAFRGKDHPWWGGGPVELECEICEDTFEVVRSQSASRRHCSYECSGKAQQRITGPDNPTWKGGHDLYHALNNLGSDTSWTTTRRRINSRDEYQCQLCDATVVQTRLDTHHIIPVLAGGMAVDDLLISLCVPCHSKTESYTWNIPEIIPLHEEYTDYRD